MAGGVFVGSVYATMRLDTGGFISDISKTKNAIGGLNGSIADSSKTTDGFTGSVFKGAFAADALMRGITAVGGAAKAAFGELLTLQNARQSFEVLTGSANNASKVMADLALYAKQTPFEFNQIAGATKTLLGFGSTVDNVGGQIRKIGDIAGATGGDIGSIALVFGQVQAQGRLMGQDFLQLINNGVALGDVLAKELGVPASEVKKKIEEGAVTFDVFNRAVTKATGAGGKFFGGADKLAQTLSGRISTLKDNFTAVIGTMVGVDFSTGIVQAGGIFDRLSQAALQANNWIAANEETINKVAGAIQGGLLFAVDSLIGGIQKTIAFIATWRAEFEKGNQLVVAGTLFIGTLGAAFVAYKTYLLGVTVATKAWAIATKLATASVALATSPITLIAVGLAALIAVGYLVVKNWDTIKAVAMDTWTNISNAVTGFVTGALTTAQNAINAFTGWIDQNKVAILSVAGVLTAIFGPALIKMGVEATIAGAKHVAAAIQAGAAWAAQAARSALAWVVNMPRVIAASVTAGASSARQAVVAGGAWVIQAVRSGAAWVAQYTMMGVRAVAAGVVMAAQASAAGWAWMAAGIKIAAVNTWMVLVRTTTMAWTAAQWLLNAALNANPIGLIIGLVALLVGGIVLLWNNSETFRNIVTGAFNAVLGAIQTAWNWVKGNWPLLLAILTGPIGIAVLMIVKNWDTIKNAFSAAWGFIKGIWGGVTGFFGGIGNGIANIFSNAVNGIRNNFNTAVDFVRGIPGKILGALGNAGTLLLDVGKNIIDGLVKGITGAAGQVTEKMKSIASGAIDTVKNFLGIKSPSRRFMEIGVFTMQGWGKGVDSQAKMMERTMYRASNAVTEAFSPNIASQMGDYSYVRSGSAIAAGSGSSQETNFNGPVNISREVDANRAISILSQRQVFVDKGLVVAPRSTANA